MKKNIVYFFISIFFVLSSCKQLDVFENNTSIPKNAWQSGFSAIGNLSINDTTSFYNIYIVLRHTDGYKYNNIWLNLTMVGKQDTVLSQKLDLLLATDATGWEGVGMNDIWEVRKPITTMPVKFKNTGNYSFTLNQLMRDNPLPGVLSAGIRIEKVKF